MKRVTPKPLLGFICGCGQLLLAFGDEGQMRCPCGECYDLTEPRKPYATPAIEYSEGISLNEISRLLEGRRGRRW